MSKAPKLNLPKAKDAAEIGAAVMPVPDYCRRVAAENNAKLRYCNKEKMGIKTAQGFVRATDETGKVVEFGDTVLCYVHDSIVKRHRETAQREANSFLGEEAALAKFREAGGVDHPMISVRAKIVDNRIKRAPDAFQKKVMSMSSMVAGKS